MEKILKDNLKRLRREKLSVNLKTLLLHPIVQPIVLFIPLLGSLGCLFFGIHGWAPFTFFISSTLCLVLFFVLFFLLLKLLIEVKNLFDKHESDHKTKILELLSKLNPELQLVKKIEILLDDNPIKVSTILEWASDKPYTLQFSTNNNEDMLTGLRVETAFEFPNEIKLENNPAGVSSYSSEKTNIYRFYDERINAQTNQLQPVMTFLPLKVGTYKINAWVKGENIKTHFSSFTIKVIA